MIGPPPADLHAEEIAIPRAGLGELKGWLAHGQPGGGAVLLMHGIRANRLALIDRLRRLQAAGFTVLAFDARAHGASPGWHTSYGLEEGDDALAALAVLKERAPGEPVAMIGISLGGAAALNAARTGGVQALVIESVYPDIFAATANRLEMRLGSAGRTLAPLLIRFMEGALGMEADRLRPIDWIASVEAPILILSGTADRHTTIEETRQLFAAARGAKELWEVEGAAHIDLRAFAPDAYDAHVLGFLARTLSP